MATNSRRIKDLQTGLICRYCGSGRSVTEINFWGWGDDRGLIEEVVDFMKMCTTCADEERLYDKNVRSKRFVSWYMQYVNPMTCSEYDKICVEVMCYAFGSLI